MHKSFIKSKCQHDMQLIYVNTRYNYVDMQHTSSCMYMCCIRNTHQKMINMKKND